MQHEYMTKPSYIFIFIQILSNPNQTAMLAKPQNHQPNRHSSPFPS